MGTKIIEFHNVSKSFGEKIRINLITIFNRASVLELSEKRHRKIYLLKYFNGAIPPDSGKITIGETVKFGYYTQDGIQVKEGKKLLT